MEIDNLLAVIFRLGIMTIIYYFLIMKFHRDYKKSKESGFRNTYFLGFTVLFLILFVFHIIYGTYELYIHAVENPFELKAQFPWYVKSDDFVGEIINNQMRPAYLAFYFLMNLVLAAQIYPLEQANGWEKNPFMKLILICGASLWLLFIPAFGNSFLAFIPVLLGFLGIALGFLLNIFILIKLYRGATGELRQKSLYGVFAFIFLAIGMVVSMEVGWIGAFSSDISYRWEVVIGSAIQIVGAVFYYLGFRQREDINEGKQGAPERMGIIKNLKGYFSKRDLMDYMVIMGILGFLCLGLAWMTYPLENEYSIMKDTISFLGSSDLDNNPEGWWLMTVSFLIFGIMLIPVALYRYRRLRKINKILASISLIFYLIASIGIILVGIFPDNGGTSYFSDLSAGRVHNIVAIFAFGGFAFGLLADFMIFLIDTMKTKMLNPVVWLIVYAVFFAVVGMIVYTQITWDMICKSNCWPGEGIYSFPLWEWIAFIMVFIVIYTIIFSLPNNLEDK